VPRCCSAALKVAASRRNSSPPETLPAGLVLPLLMLRAARHQLADRAGGAAPEPAPTTAASPRDAVDRQHGVGAGSR